MLVGDRVITPSGETGYVQAIDDDHTVVTVRVSYESGPVSFTEEEFLISGLTFFDPQGRAFTPDVQAMRAQVMQCMHSTGDRYRSITGEEHAHVRILADGFGKLPPSHPAFYDWSHVRDSSPEAIESMYIRLADMGYADRVR